MQRDMMYPVDAKLAWFDGGVNAAVLNAGTVGFGPLPSKRDSVDDLVPADLSLTSFTGFGIHCRMTVPGYNPLYDRVHFHVVVSTSPDFSYTGWDTDGLVAERFSNDAGGFFLESDSVYCFPSSGANIGLGSSQIGKSVSLIILNLSCPVSPLYVYWRPVYYLSDSFVANGSFTGIRHVSYASPSMNTFDPSAVFPQVFDICEGITWSLNVHAEVYVGLSPLPSYYLSGGDYIIHADSGVNPSGFRFFDGYSILPFPFSGVSSSYSGKKMILFTNSIPISSPLYVCSRVKWIGGSSGWTSKIFIPRASFDDVGQSYTPSIVMSIPSGQSTDYHIQVIYGTSPNFVDYFSDPGDLIPDPLSTSLVHYAFSYDELSRPEFMYFDGSSMVSPSEGGMPRIFNVVATHVMPTVYSGISPLYSFWRVVADGPWAPPMLP
jgi:hypothetical protein